MDFRENLLETIEKITEDCNSELKSLEEEIWDIYKENPKHILSMINISKIWIHSATVATLHENPSEETLKYVIRTATDFENHGRNSLINLRENSKENTIRRENWREFRGLYIDFLFKLFDEYIANEPAFLKYGESDDNN